MASAPYHPESPGGHGTMLDEIALLLESLTYGEMVDLAAGLGLEPSTLHAWARGHGLRRAELARVDDGATNLAFLDRL